MKIQKPLIKVGIVMKENLSSEAIGYNLKKAAGIMVTLQVNNGQKLMQQIRDDNLPDVILMDTFLPVINAYETTAWLTKNHPAVKVIGLIEHHQVSCLKRLFSMGATGWVLKSDHLEELINAIKTVAQQAVYITSSLESAAILKSMNEQSIGDSQLTPREKTFMYLSCSLKPYAEIAVRMAITNGTLFNYRSAVYRKLKVKNRRQLLNYCISEGLIVS